MSCDLLSLATPGVAGLQPYHPGKPIGELERELGISNIIKLASNESPLGVSRQVLGAIHDFTDYARYPDGNAFTLKAQLAERHKLTPAHLTVGNGSNDVLELITRATVTAEHEIIFSEHAFAVYPLVTRALGARAVVVPAVDWGHDLDAMQASITGRTRVIFIANPNNPTGTWLNHAALAMFLDAVPDQVIVVLDEAYYEYAQHADGYPDSSVLLQRHPNLVVTRTFSKAYGLASLRIGFALSDPALADLMNRVRQPFNVNSLAMVAAQAALQDEAQLQRAIDINRAGMQQIVDGLDSMGLHFIPSLGNFVAVNLQQPGSGVYRDLLHEGVIVRPVDNYGMPEFLRVSIGLEDENEKFLHALAKVLTG
ncbi:MAG: histidinol-phosphate transaminase [Thiotrichales bacterium]|nr:histidinol-phosphate transaminase [Thiotrichales bacterium]